MKCQYCASVIEGIASITGFLTPEPAHWYKGSLASRGLSLTGRGFTPEPHSGVDMCKLIFATVR